MLNVGDIVSHNLYGKGEIISTRNHGYFVNVRFSDYSREMICTSVKIIGQNQASQTIQSNIVKKPITAKANPSVFSNVGSSPRSMIEAFRLGVVPYGAVNNFTFGRDKEINIIKNWLKPDSNGALIIRSGYGSGKSHLLDYINGYAAENQYAVCSAEFDHETPPYRPKLIYRQFVTSFRLRVNNRELSFRDFIRELVSKQIFIYSPRGYINPIIELVKKNNGDPDLWDWVEGNRSGRYYGLGFFDNGTASNIYCHLIAEIAAATRCIQGVNGLVIALDEAERVNDATKIQQVKGWHFVRGLTMLSANDPRLINENVTWDPCPEGSYFGAKTRLVYSGHEKDLGYCVDMPSNIKVVFAFTDGRYNMENWLGDWGIGHIPMKLETISESSQREIFIRIYNLYKSCWDINLSDATLTCAYNTVKLKTQYQNGVIRYFIKGTVEILDILRYNPSLLPEEIE